MLPQLTAAAAHQLGLFTAAQARAAGYTNAERRARLKQGDWQVLRRGIYAERQTVLAVATSPYGRHRLEALAGLLALGRAAVVSHTSGCVVHQLGLVTPPPMDVTLTCAGGGTHRGTGLNVHSCELRGDEVTIQDLVPVTSLARTVLDSSRVLPFRDAVAVADQAIARDPELPDALSQLLHRYHSWPGINAASRVIAFADGRAGSVGESLSRVSFDEMGLPRPDLQVEFYDENGFIGRTDFYWRQFRTIGEFDGRLKYETVASLYAEKLREDRLRVHDEVVRFGMTDITRDKPALRRRLLAAFERGRLRPPAPQRAPWWP